MSHLIIDGGSISYWKLFSLVANNKGYDENTKKLFLMQESDGGFVSWKRVVEQELVHFIELFNPDKMTIACDGRKLWRRELFPEYKANRKKSRAEFPIDWNSFFEVRDQFFINFSKIFPTKTILIDGLEADDIIAVLTKHSDGEETIAVTGDADIHQLFKYKNFRCYDGKLRKEVTGVDWMDLLNMKILMGDKGDNIKALRPRLGEATARKILFECDGDVHGYCTKNGLMDNYLLNQRLINFEMIPRKVNDAILKAYENAKIIESSQELLAMHSNVSYSEIGALMNKNLFSFVDNE